MYSTNRFYVSHNGVELSSHIFEGAGPWIAPNTRGVIYVREGRQVKKLTASHWGFDSVTVKLWAPNEKPEYFTLR